MKGRKVAEIFLLFIPIVLLFIGQANKPATWLTQTIPLLSGVPTDELKDWLLGVGTVLSGLLIPFKIVALENKNEAYQKALDSTLKTWKEIFTELLRNTVKHHSLSVNIRILTPQKWYKKSLTDWRTGKIEFEVNNIDSLADKDNTTGLCIEVAPVPRGVVGQVYASKNMIYDTDVQNNLASYNLTPYHLQILRGLKMVVAIPIVNKDNKIIYIISIDSKDQIGSLTPVQEQKFENLVINYLSLTEELITGLTIRKSTI